MSHGQMVEDVRLSVLKKEGVFFYGRSGGGVPTQKQVEREILKIYV
jgi:2-oxoglutarate ferredoxin oxidoreductase subunit alpha